MLRLILKPTKLAMIMAVISFVLSPDIAFSDDQPQNKQATSNVESNENRNGQTSQPTHDVKTSTGNPKGTAVAGGIDAVADGIRNVAN